MGLRTFWGSLVTSSIRNLGGLLPLPPELVSGVVTDAADRSAGVEYLVLPDVSTLNPHNRLFGIVRTAHVEKSQDRDENLAGGLRFFSGLQGDEILFVHNQNSFAYFGEMMARLGASGGVGGAVVLGLSRDSHRVSRHSFPLASRGTTPVDIKGRGRVGNFDAPVVFGDFAVETGDLVFSDSDGTVVLKTPSQEMFLRHLREEIAKEIRLASDLESGKTVEQILAKYDGF